MLLWRSSTVSNMAEDAIHDLVPNPDQGTTGLQQEMSNFENEISERYQENRKQAGHAIIFINKIKESEFCKLINALSSKVDLGEGMADKSKEGVSLKYIVEKNSRFQEEGAMGDGGIYLS